MDILALIKEWIDRRERPRPIKPVCYACREEIVGPGYSFRGRRYCDSLCIPPFALTEQGPSLAGDPR
jgi:hypothetical protein